MKNKPVSEFVKWVILCVGMAVLAHAILAVELEFNERTQTRKLECPQGGVK